MLIMDLFFIYLQGKNPFIFKTVLKCCATVVSS